jgi:hypothetical protein
MPGVKERPSAVIASINEVQFRVCGPLRRAFRLGSALPTTRLSNPNEESLVSQISKIKRKEKWRLAKTDHDASFVNVNNVLRPNPAVLALPDIEVPMNRLRREGFKPISFLTSTDLSLKASVALDESGYPVAS